MPLRTPIQETPSQRESRELWSLHTPGAGTSRLFQAAPIAMLVAMTLLIALGLSMISSATIANTGARFFHTQIKWIAMGIGACLAGALLKFPLLQRRAHWGLAAIVLPLAYLTAAALAVHLCGDGAIRFFPCAALVNGAVRWLRLGPITIQPSEFAKLFLLLFLASYYGRLPREKIKRFVPGLLMPLAASGIVLALILLGKDLSTTVVTGVMVLGIMFLAGVRLRWMLIILLLGAVAGTAFIVKSPMRRDRIVAWQNPEKAKKHESYQLFRSLICLGMGGLTGKGYSKGYIKTYLPEAHTDFIVAVIGEELGFLGLMLVLTCYLLICASILIISWQCRRRAELLLCHGVALLLAVQVLVNVGVVSGWLPPTGVTAPFLSYGGSSIISLMFLIGLVLNVSLQNQRDIWKEIGSQRCLPVSGDRPHLSSTSPSNGENTHDA